MRRIFSTVFEAEQAAPDGAESGLYYMEFLECLAAMAVFTFPDPVALPNLPATHAQHRLPRACARIQIVASIPI